MDWMTFITSLIPFAMKVLGYLIDQSSLSAQMKQRFVDLVEQAASEGAISANLRDRFRDQFNAPG